MKMKTMHLAALAAFAIAGPASAANIIWQGPQVISSSIDVNTQGTLFTAKSAVGNYTVNGVGFSSSAANFAITGNVDTSPSYMGGSSYIGSNDTEGQNYASLMDGGTRTNVNGTLTITFSNLSLNQNYLIQYWVADYRPFPNDRNVELTAGNTSGLLRYLDNDNTFGVHGSYVIGTFTADATSQSIAISAGAGSDGYPMMNAVQLRAVPEPSAALLGGLGMLALLRRRR